MNIFIYIYVLWGYPSGQIWLVVGGRGARGWFNCSTLNSAITLHVDNCAQLVNCCATMFYYVMYIYRLWSEFGVEEARTIFWDCLEKGKGIIYL